MSTVKKYSTEDLNEFKVIIERKLKSAQDDLTELRSSLMHDSVNGTDDTSFSSHNMDEGNNSMEREELMMLAIRQEKFIEQLMNALARIHNGSYGICRVTGELIPKARLLSVPHATMTTEAKLQRSKS